MRLKKERKRLGKARVQPIPSEVTFSEARSQSTKLKLIGLFSPKRGKIELRALASCFGNRFLKCHFKWDRLYNNTVTFHKSVHCTSVKAIVDTSSGWHHICRKVDTACTHRSDRSVQFNLIYFQVQLGPGPLSCHKFKVPVPYSPPSVGAYTRTPSHYHPCSFTPSSRMIPLVPTDLHTEVSDVGDLSLLIDRR